MNIYIFLLKRFKFNIILAIFTGLASGIATTLLIANINKALSEQSDDRQVYYFIFIALIVLFSSLISQLTLVKISHQAVYNLRLQLSQGILSADLLHLEKQGCTKLMANLIEDVQSLSGSIGIIPFLCINIAVFCACLVYLAWISTTIFLVTVILFVLLLSSIKILMNKARYFFQASRQEEDNLYRHFRSITEGIKELKLNEERTQAFFKEELQTSAAAICEQDINGASYFAIANSWINLLFFCIVGILLFALPKFLTVSHNSISAYILTLTYLMVPLRETLQQLPYFYRGNVALEKLDSMGISLAIHRDIIDKSQFMRSNKKFNQNSLDTVDSIEIKKVSHTYKNELEDKKFCLNNINLKFLPGEITFIVGGNGSGKSTLAKLIMGLYIPEKGEIRLNNQIINDNNRKWYRQYFTAIFSDFYLFDKLLGVDKYRLKEQAQEYLQQLQLDQKVKINNCQFSTIALSQGQQKRLALLTAYLENRPIYLFDEWASDQDPIFREIFYKEILVQLKEMGKIVIVISHDDRYFHVADKIIKLDYGNIEFIETRT